MTLTDTELAIGVAVIALAGVLLGSMVSGLFALMSSWIDDRREHRRWLREKRFVAYRNAISILDRSRATMERQKAGFKNADEAAAQIESLRDFMKDLPDTYLAVFLVGPRKVSASLMRATGHAVDYMQQAVDKTSGDGQKVKELRLEFLESRAQFVRDVQDEIRAGSRSQRVTKDDAEVFRELRIERERKSNANP